MLQELTLYRADISINTEVNYKTLDDIGSLALGSDMSQGVREGATPGQHL